MTIASFDHLPQNEKKKMLIECCSSSCWVDKMLPVFPVEDLVELLDSAEEKWFECSEEDWKEAFSQHPKIGDLQSIKTKFAATAHLAAGEQSGVSESDADILQALADANKTYEEKFGYIFIVCASGKSAAEMLGILQSRLSHEPGREIRIAADEQNQITKLRLEKIFES